MLDLSVESYTGWQRDIFSSMVGGCMSNSIAFF